MVRFIHTYPYLMLSLTMLGVFLAALALTPMRLRAHALLSGVLAAPFALTSVLLVPSYWDPVRVAVFLAGPEDLLFTFAGGGLASAASVRLVRRPLTLRPSLRRIWWRYVAGAVLGLAAGDTCWRMGGTPMTATVMAFCLLTGVVLVRRPELWSLALAGATSYAAVYAAALKLWHVIVPNFGSQWNPAGLWGPSVIGLPLDELVWAAAFGLAWPTFAAYLFDARLQPAPFSPPSEP